VVPIIIDGTGDIVSKGSNVSKTLDKKEVSITFLDPIYPKEDEGFVSFRRRVKVEMQTAIENS
jgi:1-acyl-sn-glycerol-3-phosphate acyltransferase